MNDRETRLVHIGRKANPSDRVLIVQIRFDIGDGRVGARFDRMAHHEIEPGDLFRRDRQFMCARHRIIGGDEQSRENPEHGEWEGQQDGEPGHRMSAFPPVLAAGFGAIKPQKAPHGEAVAHLSQPLSPGGYRRENPAQRFPRGTPLWWRSYRYLTAFFHRPDHSSADLGNMDLLE